MNRRSVVNLVMAGCIVAVACVDLSAPAGAAAISELRLPATFVVRGDSMRDSLGRALPPAILAFSQKGDSDTLKGASLFTTDSIKRVRFLQNGVIFGDSLGVAHVVGQTGSLQTGVFSLPVTVEPVVLARLAQSDTDTLRAPIAADSASSRASIIIPLRVTGKPTPTGADTAVQGVWVTYQWVRRPASRDPAHQAAFLVNRAGDTSMVDTTDASGLTSNQIVVIGSFLSILSDTAFATGHKVDTVKILANVTYKGKPLQNSPLLVVIPLKSTFNVK